MKKPTRQKIEALLQEDVELDALVAGLKSFGFSVEIAAEDAFEHPLIDRGVWVMPQDGTTQRKPLLVWSDRGAVTTWTASERGVAQTARDLIEGWWVSERARGTAKGANREAVMGALLAAAKRGEALSREQIAREARLDPVAVSNVLYQTRELVTQDPATGLYTPRGWRVRVIIRPSFA